MAAEEDARKGVPSLLSSQPGEECIASNITQVRILWFLSSSVLSNCSPWLNPNSKDKHLSDSERQN